MKFKKSILSLAVSATLVGCGSSSDSDGKEKRADDIVEKNSLVCVDVNQNARCDAAEVTEEVVTWTGGDIETILASTDLPLAYEGEDGQIFTAPAGSSIVSPTTTLLANEHIYNQVITSKTHEAIIDYIAEKLGGELSDTHKAGYATAIKNALNNHAASDRYAVIAAVTNKFFTLAVSRIDDIKSISVTADEISQAHLPSLVQLNISEAINKNVDAQITAQETAGWIDAKDASMRSLSASNGRVIGGSHYHNSLSVLDLATGELIHSPVSVVTDAGHGVDAKSGASENYLRDAELNSDASYAYVNIPPKKSSSTKRDRSTYGFYKAKIEVDGSIATTTDGTVIAIDERVSTRLIEIVNAFAVSSDDSHVALYDNEGYLTVYDANLENPGSSEELDIETFAISADTVFTVTKRKNNADETVGGDINLLAIDSLASNSVIQLDFVPAELLLNDDGTRLVAFNHGHDNSGEMDIALINLLTADVNAASVTVTSDTADISPDFSKLAIVGHEESRLLIVNLTVPGFSVQSAFDLEHGSSDVAFVNNDQVAILADRNSIAVLDIASSTDNINLEAKTEAALKGLNAASINGGGFFNAVIQDVVLSDHYENIGITWSEAGLTGYLNSSDGVVTRPAAIEENTTGTLTANTVAAFRDDTVVGTKSFDITVRKAPALLPAAEVVQTGDNSSQYMASNADGNIMVAPVRFKNADDKNVYGIHSVEVVSSQPELRTFDEVTVDSNGDDLDTPIINPVTFSDTETIAGVGIYGSNVIAVSAALGETGQARIFTVTMDAHGNIASDVNESINIASGEPLKVGFNTAQSIAAVMIKKDDGSYITEIYNIDTAGVLSLERTIAMAAETEYKSYGPPAINDDGTVVYQRDGDNVIMSTESGASALAAVEEIARVWFYNGQVFVNTYEGNITSFDASLRESSRQSFSIGTGGRMYGAVGRALNGKHYLYVPVQRSADENLNGVYQLEIKSDGSLEEIAFSVKTEGADRMAVSGDGDTIFFSYRVRSGDDKGRWFGVVEVPTNDQ